MTPSIEVRIRSIIKALEQIVLPAIDPNSPLASEQGATAVRHLHVILSQVTHAADFELICLNEAIKLGRTLVIAAQGGTQTMAAAEMLRQAISALEDRDLKGDAATQARSRLSEAIDRLLTASSIDANAAFLKLSGELVLTHGEEQARRDRAWFSASGLDPDAATLPTIAEMLSTHQSGVGAVT